MISCLFWQSDGIQQGGLFFLILVLTPSSKFFSYKCLVGPVEGRLYICCHFVKSGFWNYSSRSRRFNFELKIRIWNCMYLCRTITEHVFVEIAKTRLDIIYNQSGGNTKQSQEEDATSWIARTGRTISIFEQSSTEIWSDFMNCKRDFSKTSQIKGPYDKRNNSS